MKQNRKIIISLIVVVLVLAGGIFAYSRQKSDNGNDNPNGSDAGLEFDDLTDETSLPGEPDLETEPILENVNVNVPTEGPEFEAAKKRDEQRLKDIRAMSDALKDFVNDKGNYPSQIEELVPRYLSSLPTNPEPGAFAYSYTPIGSEPASYYSLYYALEVGVEDIPAGDHEATPEGIATL